MNPFDTLLARGFIKQHTDADALRRAFDAGPVVYYAGFDPTAPSFHVGNLVPIMAMAWLQKAGHRGIVVHGGGTAMIGDPSGKDKSRDLISPETIKENLAGQRGLFAKYLDLVPEQETPGAGGSWPAGRAILRDNADWLMGLGYIHFLRDIGRHFSVNHMLSAEGTQQRLERGQGLSFIEFNYHLLQSYDYLVLHREYGCTVQLGGDDQWFHILGGADLIRRETGNSTHGFTLPLIATADGKKMGKSEGGSVWVDAARLSPYNYYQFWVNVHDQDVERFLKLYTFLDLERIAELAALQGADIRTAKRALAWEATALAHGPEEATKAAEAAQAAFSGGASADMPTLTVSLPKTVLSILVESGLAKSNSDARRLLQAGGVSLGDEKVTDPAALVEREVVVWAGKKRAVRVVEG